MKWVRYSKYTGDDLGIGSEDLLQALADFLLGSGFNLQYVPSSDWNDHTLEELKAAIQHALEQGQLFDSDAMQEMIEHRFIPNIEHAVGLQRRFQRVRAECAQCHCCKTERGSDAKEREPAHLPPKNFRNDWKRRLGSVVAFCPRSCNF